MFVENKQYSDVDVPFFKKEIESKLPKEILDFHVHLVKKEFWNKKIENREYMTVHEMDFGSEKLIDLAAKMFPRKKYKAVCFGIPGFDVELDINNNYIAQVGRKEKSIYPLIVTGKSFIPPKKLEEELIEKKFLGYKVFLNWDGDDYGNITIDDMIGKAEMSIADKYNLIVLLHVPRSDRLADPEVQKGVRKISKNYPGAQIVLAHCGRCYMPDLMKRSVSSIKDLKNVYLDTSMVMEPDTIEILINEIDSKRILFATDFPIASMRGRRTYVMDHWVDVVLKGYPESMYRVQSDNIRATFMSYEIMMAIIRAAEKTGLSDSKTKDIFHDNGMRLINKVSI